MSAAGALVLATLATGCSASASISTGGPRLSKEKVAQQVAAKLTETVGQTPDDVSCPEDLEGKGNAKIRCTLTAGSDKFGVTVTTTAVDGDNIKFFIKVDDAVQPS